VWYWNSIATFVTPADRPEFSRGIGAQVVQAVLAVSLLLPCAYAEEKQVQKTIENSVGIKMTLIPSGAFTMGAPEDEVGSRIDEYPALAVKISAPFYMGVYEITQAEYEKVAGVNPSYFSPSGDGRMKVENLNAGRLPVEQVSWDDCVA
jgi:formylglycine-generating enzyme required for sulfatase activity